MDEHQVTLKREEWMHVMAAILNDIQKQRDAKADELHDRMHQILQAVYNQINA